jgi:hypothetical protein
VRAPRTAPDPRRARGNGSPAVGGCRASCRWFHVELSIMCRARRAARLNVPRETHCRWRRTFARGTPAGHLMVCSKTAYAPSLHGTRWSPSSASAADGQRSPCTRGGSLTTRRPPIRKNGAAHSAVTAGRPKPRATTASWLDRQDASRPSTSARAVTTRTRSVQPSRDTARRSQSVRLSLASNSTTAASGRAAAMTKPGTPPPLPRSKRLSKSRNGGRKPRAWVMTSPADREPRKPTRRASLRISRSAASPASSSTA